MKHSFTLTLTVHLDGEWEESTDVEEYTDHLAEQLREHTLERFQDVEFSGTVDVEVTGDC